VCGERSSRLGLLAPTHGARRLSEASAVSSRQPPISASPLFRESFDMEIALTKDFKNLAATLWAKKAGVAVISLLAFALSWAGFAMLPPSYEASALIQINPQKSSWQNEGAAPNAALRQDEYLNTQAIIVSSGEVVRGAIAEIGVDRLYPNDNGLFASLKNSAPSFIESVLKGASAAFGCTSADCKFYVENLFAHKTPAELEKRAYAKSLASLTARVEKKTELLKISFRHQNPEIAAQFVTVLVQKYINRHVDLAARVNGAGFMETERLKFEIEFANASADLMNFSVSNDLYAADAQQDIILARRKELQLRMGEATSKVSQREAELGELTRQLMRLKINAMAPQFAELVRQSAYNATSNPPSRAPAGNPDTGPLPNNDPPLLLVRVYQDVAESVVRMNAELIGLRELAREQKDQLSGLYRELSQLTAKRAEFEALKRRVDVARRSAEIFATKAVELRTELGLNRQQLVSPQLVQDAVVPLTPSFPTTPIKFLAGLVIAFAGIAGLVLAPVKALSRQSETNPDFSDADARRPGRRGFGPPIGEAAARARDFT